MELKSITNLDEILTNFHFDKIYCSEDFFKKIVEKYFFITNGEITLDGWSDSRMGHIIFKNKSIDLYLDFSMSSKIILGYQNIKSERKVKLDGIYNSTN